MNHFKASSSTFIGLEQESMCLFSHVSILSRLTRWNNLSFCFVFWLHHHRLAVVTVGVWHPSCQPTALWLKYVTENCTCHLVFFPPHPPPLLFFSDLLKHARPSLTPIDSAWHLDATWDSKHMLPSTIPRTAVRSTHTDRRRFHLCGLTWKETLVRERPRFCVL